MITINSLKTKPVLNENFIGLAEGIPYNTSKTKICVSPHNNSIIVDITTYVLEKKVRNLIN